MSLYKDNSKTAQKLGAMKLGDSETDALPSLKPDEDEFKSHSSFDTVIGHIEDMLVDDSFHNLQVEYLEKYWHEFSDCEENKHCYMSIFKQYTEGIETFITDYLQSRIPNFKMEDFTTELQKHRSLEGEVFEVLLTLTDFNAFKELFIEYRQMKEGRSVDLSSTILVSSLPIIKW